MRPEDEDVLRTSHDKSPGAPAPSGPGGQSGPPRLTLLVFKAPEVRNDLIIGWISQRRELSSTFDFN